ncbi:hypothetical protein FB45DRAFT_870441 [Roridomyces roridus]|uniref:Uncharacterized protein n=1 Tax=Roridomyces roridus TaxID=1738132 RepID=A0AAD7FJB8_9AGAR|nr:hypothetical protein FB45DRAFT_870441 [Roridomyces roridus]
MSICAHRMPSFPIWTISHGTWGVSLCLPRKVKLRVGKFRPCRGYGCGSSTGDPWSALLRVHSAFILVQVYRTWLDKIPILAPSLTCGSERGNLRDFPSKSTGMRMQYPRIVPILCHSPQTGTPFSSGLEKNFYLYISKGVLEHPPNHQNFELIEIREPGRGGYNRAAQPDLVVREPGRGGYNREVDSEIDARGRGGYNRAAHPDPVAREPGRGGYNREVDSEIDARGRGGYNKRGRGGYN